MGPGVAGQFPSLDAAEQGGCQNCHAPMSEQWARLPSLGGGWQVNTAFDDALRSRGLVCAACHLREHRRFGPLPTPARIASGGVRASALLHGEPVRTELFSAAEFCSGCHQHAAGTLRINGKTVENTYQEWLASPYPGQGKTCQTCHMPERRHLWRGIHDPETTRAGVTVTATVEPVRPAVGEGLEARLTLANTGTGHAFPTYTTPAVILKAALLDADGQVLPGGFYAEKILQRRLDMDTSPWGERFDTRVLPGEGATLTFARRVPPGAVSLYLWVWVEPDHFYTAFYRGYLAGGRDFPGAALLEEALRNSLESQYLLFSRTVPLDGRP
jgi:hypothetical protein